MMSTGVGVSSSATSSARRDTATVPLVDAITMRVHAGARRRLAHQARAVDVDRVHAVRVGRRLCETIPAR